MDERPLHIVITGHVDHGKSTLVGRLFYETGSLPEEKVEELRRISGELGKELEWAFLIDNLEEERRRGITIDVAHTFFSTQKRRYVVIDAPGHKEFLKNMITGSSQAEAALLLVDATRGVEEQTRRHCYILSLIGITQVAVLVNKMDAAGYSEGRFEAVKKEAASVFSSLGLCCRYVIPVSARDGDNVAARSERLPWYKGPTVVEALDSFTTAESAGERVRFPVQDVYGIGPASMAVGRVEAGTIKKGQDVFIMPEGRRGRIKWIKKFMEEDLIEAAAGECVGVLLEEGEVRRGETITEGPSATVTDSIRANIFWLLDREYRLGIPLTWRCATQEGRARIVRIHRRFDPASIELIERDAVVIAPAEVAEVEIRLDKSVAVDAFSLVPETGRFVLEHEGHPVAGGIIL